MDVATLQRQLADEIKNLCERTRDKLKALEPEHDRYRQLLGRLDALENHPGTAKMGDLIGQNHSYYNGRLGEWLDAVIRGLGGKRL